MSWIPNCAGAWFTDPLSPVATMSVVGVPARNKNPPFIPDMSAVGTTSALIQSITRKEVASEIGLLVNYDVSTGGSHPGTKGQKVGIADFVRLRPGTDGSKPGAAWAFNPDIQVSANSGNVFAINTEADFNNFNDCKGAGCFGVMLWHNYLSSFPITADTYISGDSDTHRGTARVEGTRLISSEGALFTNDATTVSVDGQLVRIDAVKDAHTVALAENMGNRPRASYVWRSHLVHTGLMIAGDNAVSEHDFLSGSSAYYGFYLIGHHNVLLATSGDTAPYLIAARPGQALCLNGLDGCLLNADANRLRYQVKNNPVLEAVGTQAPGASYAVVRNGISGAQIGVDGPTPSAPLELSGKNGAPVAVVGSPLKLPIYKIAALPPCNAGAIGEEAFVADSTAISMPAWHGTVRDGGHARVRSVVACNGENWQYE